VYLQIFNNLIKWAH